MQGAVHGALGQHPGAGLGVLQRRQQGVQLMIVEAAFDADSPLTVGWQALLRLDKGGDAVRHLQSFQTGGCQNDGVIFTGIQLGEASVDVAAQIPDHQVGAGGTQLALATQAGGADHGPLRQLGNGLEAVGDEGIARIFPYADGVQTEPLGELHRHVFHGVDGDVGAPFQHGCLQLLDEQPLAAHFGQRGIEDLVTLSAHRYQFDLQLWMQGFKLVFYKVGLPQGQRALASGNFQGSGCHINQLFHF